MISSTDFLVTVFVQVGQGDDLILMEFPQSYQPKCFHLEQIAVNQYLQAVSI